MVRFTFDSYWECIVYCVLYETVRRSDTNLEYFVAKVLHSTKRKDERETYKRRTVLRMIAMKKKTKRGYYTKGSDCDFDTNLLPSLTRTVEPISLYLRVCDRNLII